MMFRIVIFIICSMVCLWGCGGSGGDGGGNDDLPPPLGDTYPIDGIVDFTDFDTVYELDVDIFDNAGQGNFVKTTTVRWVITNDDRNIYFAFEWTDDTYDHDYDINLGPLVFEVRT